jgi:hypothetical protein
MVKSAGLLHSARTLILTPHDLFPWVFQGLMDDSVLLNQACDLKFAPTNTIFEEVKGNCHMQRLRLEALSLPFHVATQQALLE